MTTAKNLGIWMDHSVITGGTFGDVTSPVAGMTNMSSNIAHAAHTKYLKYASPYNFISTKLRKSDNHQSA